MTIEIDELLENKSRELHIEALDDTILVRDPTTKDKIEARTQARKHPLWDEMSELEKSIEESSRLALKIIVEPEITYDDYKNCTSPKIDVVIETVLRDWNERLEEYTEKNREELRNFLQQERENSQKSSTNS